jgi:hypothetical protein
MMINVPRGCADSNSVHGLEIVTMSSLVNVCKNKVKDYALRCSSFELRSNLRFTDPRTTYFALVSMQNLYYVA